MSFDLDATPTLVGAAQEALALARTELSEDNYLPIEKAGVARALAAGFEVTEAALQSDQNDLRGNIASAHACLKRIDILRIDANRVWGATKELIDALEAVEAAAAAAGYAEPLAPIGLPAQYLVPRQAIAEQMDVLAASLADLEAELERLSEAKAHDPEHATQDAVIAYAVTATRKRSVIAAILAAAAIVDLRGIAQAADGIGQIALDFWHTVTASAARVTQRVREQSKSYFEVSKRVVRESNPSRTMPGSAPDDGLLRDQIEHWQRAGQVNGQ